MKHHQTTLIGVAACAIFLALLIPAWDTPDTSERVPALAAVNRQLNHLLPWRKNLSSYLADAGQEMRRRNDNDRALQLFESAVRVAPRSATAWEQLLDMQIRQNDLKAARQTAVRLEQLDPQNPTALNLKGYDLATQGKLEEAISAYRRGKSLASRDITVLLNQQEGLVRTQQLDRAEWLTAQASSLIPEENTFHNNLAWYYQQYNARLPIALRHAKKALEINPEDANARDTLAWVYLKLGKAEESAHEARRALAAKPLSESEMLLGIIRSRQGRFEEAVQHFCKGYRLVARDPEVRRLVEEAIKRVEPRLTAEQKQSLRSLRSPVRRRSRPWITPPGAPGRKATPPPHSAMPAR